MTESEKHAATNGLGISTQVTRDENGNWFTLITLQIGILSASLALPVDSVPGVAAGLRKAILDGYKDTVAAQARENANKLVIGSTYGKTL